MYEILDLNSMYVSHFHTFEYYADMLFPLVEPFAGLNHHPMPSA